MLCLAVLLIGGCGRYPRDPRHTLERVEGHVMRVGVSQDAPFVVLRSRAAPTGREIELLQAYARSLRARVVWVEDGHADLMQALEEGRLHAVVGGHGQEAPRSELVAFSAPYDLRGDHGSRARRVLALPPGENAWLMRFETFVRSAEAVALLGAEHP